MRGILMIIGFAEKNIRRFGFRIVLNREMLLAELIKVWVV